MVELLRRLAGMVAVFLAGLVVDEPVVVTTVPPTTLPPSPPPTARAPATTNPDILACIRSYEGDYDTDTGNGYYGAFQFDLETWASVGGTGNPAHASPAEQDYRAQLLYNERGLSPWPTPSRHC